LVVDAGDRTINISSYIVNSTSPLRAEEFHEPKCNCLVGIQPIGLTGTSGFWQGGEVVTARARAYAECKSEIALRTCFLILFSPPPARFKNSKFDNEQDIRAFTENFDTGLKEIFSENSKPHFVRFGSARDNDANCGVKSGRFTLQG